MNDGERLELLAAHAAKRLARAIDRHTGAVAELDDARTANGIAAAALDAWNVENPVPPGMLF